MYFIQPTVANNKNMFQSINQSINQSYQMKPFVEARISNQFYILP